MSKRGNGEGSAPKYNARYDRWDFTLSMGEDGSRPRSSAKTQKEALVKKRQMESDRAAGIIRLKKAPTVEEFLTEWLKHVATYRKPETARNYRVNMNMVIPHIGKIRVDRLTTKHIDDMQRTLLTSDTKRYGLETVRVCRTVLTQAMDQAMKWYALRENVVRGAIRLPPAQKAEYTVLTLEQAQSLATLLDWHTHGLMFSLMLGLGLRRGETMAIRWEDVDLDRGVLHITGTIHDTAGSPRGSTKGNESRDVPLSDHLIAFFRRQRIEQRKQELRATKWRDTGYVFTTSVGTAMHGSYVSEQFKIILQRAGLPDMRIHDLRHTCISLMLANGSNLKDVSEIAGHKSPAFTGKRYGHAYESGKRSAVDTLGDKLRKKEVG